MIPNANNTNNFNNQIKIQLTTDNKCLIQAITESPIKSQNTIQKEDFSINDDMSLSKSNNSLYNNINNNNSHNESKPIILNSNKKNSNNDLDSNSNLLISFSNISEVTKINNNDNSMTRINSNKNNSILMNKEKDFVKNYGNISNINNNITSDKNLTINNFGNFEGNSVYSNNNFSTNNEKSENNKIKTPMRNGIQNNEIVNKNKTSNKKAKINEKIMKAFNKNDLSEMSCGVINLNLNPDDKSENYDKVNFVYSDKKSEENSININIKNSDKKENADIISNSNNKKNNVKCFKNCSVQKNEIINIIQANPPKEKSSENNKDIIQRNQGKIIPNHCANFSFSGNIKNSKLKELELNTLSSKNDETKQKSANLNIFQNKIDTNTINNSNPFDLKDDYISPTFNLNLNYNSLDKNNTNTLDIESSKEKEASHEIYGPSKFSANNISIKNYDNLVNNNKETSNFNIKKKKERNKKDILLKKNSDKANNNGNNLKTHLMLNKININNDYFKMNKTQEKNISITTNSNNNTKTNSIKEKEKKETEPKLSLKQMISKNNDFTNLNNIINNLNLNLNGKNNNNNSRIFNNKNKQNSRYKHFYDDSVHINYDLILKNFNNSMNESDRKRKLGISSHNKSRSGTNSLIKFQGLHKNIFSIINRNNTKSNNINSKAKKFKSISPKIQRRNMNNCCLKLKYKVKSKSQNRKRSNSKGSMNQKDKNQVNLLLKNKKSNLNMKNIYLAKPRTIQEKMDFIFSKNILALTKKIRKSPSPKMRLSRQSLIKNVAINTQGKIIDNPRKNNFLNKTNNNMNRNSSKDSKIKKKSFSPINFKILNSHNGNYIYNLCNTNTNPNSNKQKSILYLNNNNINNYMNDNLLLINNHDNSNSRARRKKSGNSPKNIDENHNCINQKKNIQFYDNINVNNNYQKVKCNKNNATMQQKGKNSYKLEEEFNKRIHNSKNKSLLMNDINKKNNIIIINNIKISNNNNNTNKKNMTIIQNFSKYKKKGENNLVNTNKYLKKNCQNENISNNYIFKGKNINEERRHKKII